MRKRLLRKPREIKRRLNSRLKRMMRRRRRKILLK
jgi:hypothetical protein